MDRPDYPVAVMDGTCALCTRGARMIHRLDRRGEIRICPIQTDMGRALLVDHDLDPDDPESWIFIDETGSYGELDGLIRIGQRCGGWGRVFLALRLIPRPIRNWLYVRVARNRYRLFGQGDICALPDPALRARLVG